MDLSKPFSNFPKCSLFAALIIGTITLTGCSGSAPAELETSETPLVAEAENETAADDGNGAEDPQQTPEEPDAEEPGTEKPDAEEPAVAGLEDTDFGNLTWIFRPGGNTPETEQIELVDGAATNGTITYELGEVIHTDLNDDDLIDAVVQLTSVDANAVDEQWYLWIATDLGPVQSTLPVARMAHCGTAIHSVTAVSGGIEIHETRRSVSDQNVACSDLGSDERIRTISAVEARNAGEWWPVQTAPIEGFGGLCPMTTHLDTYPNDADLYTVADLEAGGPIAFDGPNQVFEIEGWPVYGEPFGGWVLAGVKYGEHQGCAWAERP